MKSTDPTDLSGPSCSPSQALASPSRSCKPCSCSSASRCHRRSKRVARRRPIQTHQLRCFERHAPFFGTKHRIQTCVYLLCSCDLLFLQFGIVWQIHYGITQGKQILLRLLKRRCVFFFTCPIHQPRISITINSPSDPVWVALYIS